MKTTSAQQEILLMTGTSFSSRNWCGNDAREGEKNISPEDMLKEACWNGLLPEMLPEICTPAPGDKKLYMWHIIEGGSFIDVIMGEVPGETEKCFSINPYSFLSLQVLS
jgi:hypothetical protein